jgi:hypothetical protein
MLKHVCGFGCVVLIVGLMFIAGGCSQKVTARSVRSNMTPELQSIAHMSEQRKNRTARTMHTNMRQIWDDLDAILMLERPVRLSEYPIP